MQATLVSVLLIGLLLLTGAPRFLEPWFYGLFLKSKGEPPVSTTTVLVSADPGSGGLDAPTIARLIAAILKRKPAVLALGPSEKDSAGLESPGGSDPLPSGILVLSHSFSGLRPWTHSDNPGPFYPPILARSLYPLLDGPEPGLNLPMGEAMDLSDTLIPREMRESGGSWSQASTGFVAPLGDGGIFSIPAFLRLNRGVVAALGIEAARRSLGLSAEKIGYVEGVGVLFDAGHVLPMDARGRIPIRFPGKEGIPRIPASRFLEGRVSGSEVQGKIVFVDPASPDQPMLRTVAGLRTPTEIQAAAAANFLEGPSLSVPAWGGTLALVIGLSLAGLIALAMFLEFGGLAAFALALLLAALYPAIAFLLFRKASLWLPPELPPLMVAALYLPLALARVLAPADRPKANRLRTIQPSPGYDPALVPMPSMAKATIQPVSIPSLQPQSPKPRPSAPRERQGGDPGPRPSLPGFSDPRDPSILPDPALEAKPSAQPPRPATPAVPAPAHPGAFGEEIERDAKGGLIRVGKYRIVRKMGFGSGGDVFEGFDTHMGRKVAIKTITKNAPAHFDRASERFVLEAKAAGSLNHPCINTIYDFGTIREVSYMVLEFLDGVTLSQWMRGNPVPPRPRAVAHWLRQISSALDYAHSHKIIHRDLKPANLMVVDNGATIKLLDFGIAKMEDVGLTQTGMTVGTPSYMSPEQLGGAKVGPGSDQYGLAVVMYQLFTYKLPYIGTKIPELCNRILKNEIIPLTDLDPSLGAPFWEALRKAMAKTPERRYANCMELYAALEAAFPDP